MKAVVAKAESAGTKKIILTERGFLLRLQQSRLRHALASDHAHVRIPSSLRRTHSAQLPGAGAVESAQAANANS